MAPDDTCDAICRAPLSRHVRAKSDANTLRVTIPKIRDYNRERESHTLLLGPRPGNSCGSVHKSCEMPVDKASLEFL